jgi:hypothetical protein
VHNVEVQLARRDRRRLGAHHGRLVVKEETLTLTGARHSTGVAGRRLQPPAQANPAS